MAQCSNEGLPPRILPLVPLLNPMEISRVTTSHAQPALRSRCQSDQPEATWPPPYQGLAFVMVTAQIRQASASISTTPSLKWRRKVLHRAVRLQLAHPPPETHVRLATRAIELAATASTSVLR